MRNCEEFSPARIALQREVNKHPLLVDLLLQSKANGQDEWGEQLAEIAAFCGVVMDGDYYPSELEPLYDKLYFELRAARSIITK